MDIRYLHEHVYCNTHIVFVTVLVLFISRCEQNLFCKLGCCYCNPGNVSTMLQRQGGRVELVFLTLLSFS